MKRIGKKFICCICAITAACMLLGCGGKGDKDKHDWTPQETTIAEGELIRGVLRVLGSADGVTFTGETTEKAPFTLRVCGEDYRFDEGESMRTAYIGSIMYDRLGDTGRYASAYASDAGVSLAGLAAVPNVFGTRTATLTSEGGIYTLHETLADKQDIESAIIFVTDNRNKPCGDVLAHAMHPDYTAEMLATDLRAMLADGVTLGAFDRAFNAMMKHIHRTVTLAQITDFILAQSGITAQDIYEETKTPFTPTPKPGEGAYTYLLRSGGAILPLDTLLGMAGDTSVAEIRARVLPFVEDETLLFGDMYDAFIAPKLAARLFALMRANGASEAVIERLGSAPLSAANLSRLHVGETNVTLTLRVENETMHIRDFMYTDIHVLSYDAGGETVVLSQANAVTTGTVSYDTGSVSLPEDIMAAPCFLTAGKVSPDEFLTDDGLVFPLSKGQNCTILGVSVDSRDMREEIGEVTDNAVVIPAGDAENLLAYGGLVRVAYRNDDRSTGEIVLAVSPAQDEESKA